MAKSRDLSNPLKTVSFRCAACFNKFQAEPDRVEDSPKREWHPFSYFCACPYCGMEAEQASHEKALMASFGRHTGPKTAAGKRISAQNIDGHPTAEEAQRTRFNAITHGLSARVATYYPAKPGKYPACETCHVDHYECSQSQACMKRTELFMRHHIAFQMKDPEMLTDIRADLQANVQAIIDDIIQSIIIDGVTLRNPAWYYDKDGGFHLAEYSGTNGERFFIEEVKAHPLLKTLGEFISKNNLSLGDMAMTPKVVDDQETLQGHLATSDIREEESLAVQHKQVEILDDLKNMVKRSRERAENDPVLIEHQGATRD